MDVTPGAYKLHIFCAKTGTSQYCTPDGTRTDDMEKISGSFTISPTQAKAPPCGNYGDLDNDGLITENDLTIIRQGILGITQLSGDQSQRADVDGNGLAVTSDIVLIRRYMLGMISTFPVCMVPSTTTDNTSTVTSTITDTTSTITSTSGNP